MEGVRGKKDKYEQCLAQPSSEELPPTAAGNKYRPTLHRGCEFLEHLALSGIFPQNPSPQGSGNPTKKKRQKECKIQRGWRTARKHEQGTYEFTETEAVCAGPA